MDFVSLGFLALFCVLGGFIAVFADRWGRALGKQRRSVFGLRPRRTAELIVFLSGVFIPLVTILLVLGVSSDVRQWLLEGRHALAEVKQRKEEIKRLETAGDRLRLTNEGLEKRNAQLVAGREKLQSEIGELRKRASKFESDLERASHQVARLRSDIAKERQALVDVQKRLAKRVEEYDKLVAEKEKVAKEKAKLDSSFTELDTRIRELDAQFRSTLTEIDAKKKEIEALTNDKGRLERDLADKQGELMSIQQKLQLAQDSYKEVSQQLNEAQTQLQALANYGLPSRFQKLTYNISDEVVRVEVDMNLTPQEARAALTGLLRSARTEAERRGAKANAKMQSADLGAKRLDNGQLLTSEEQQDALVNLMTGKPDPIVIIATSFTNAFQGEPVQLTIALYRNPIVFRIGDVLADSRIDGSKDVGEVHRQLVEYFQDQVRATAKRRGVIPVVGREDPFGSVPSEVVLDLVWRIKETGRAIRVQTISTADTRAGDPLKLDYILR